MKNVWCLFAISEQKESKFEAFPSILLNKIVTKLLCSLFLLERSSPILLISWELQFPSISLIFVYHCHLLLVHDLHGW